MAADYEAQLKELDVKVGRLHTVGDWNQIAIKAERQPEAITEADLIIIGHFAGESKVAQVRERRRLARNPPQRAAVSRAPSAAPAPAADVAALDRRIRHLEDAAAVSER